MELTDAQKKLLITLAEQGPLSGYDIHAKQNIMSNAYWNNQKQELGPDGQGLIFEIDTPDRRKPYWLTFRGVKDALLLGADPKRVKKQASKYLSGSDLQLTNEMCDYVGIVGVELAQGVISLITENRFVYPLDLGRDYDQTAEEMGEFIDKYPGYREPMQKLISKALKKLGLNVD